MSSQEEALNVKVFILFIFGLGVSFLYFNVPEKSVIGLPFIFLVALNILSENLDVPLPRGQSYVSVGFAIDLAIIILFGPAAASWASFSTILHFRTLRNYRKKFYRILFNSSQFALSSGLAGYAYVYAGGVPGQVRLPYDVFPIIISVFVYFLVNASLVTIFLSMLEKTSFFGAWMTNFRFVIPNYFALSPLGLLIAVVHLNMGIPGVLLLVIPLMVARHTFIMYMDMRQQYLSTILALTKAIDAKDSYTHGHSERVARYAVQIGQEMNLPEDFLEKLEYLALMHDIGKIGIPESILNKPSKLSDEEFEIVRAHAAVGAEIISNIKFIGEHSDIVRHHHERMDGSGYPDGLLARDISLGAKIVSVADAFDAMTSKRAYHGTRTIEEAVEELRRCCNTQFCQDVVEAFIKVLRRKGELR